VSFCIWNRRLGLVAAYVLRFFVFSLLRPCRQTRLVWPRSLLLLFVGPKTDHAIEDVMNAVAMRYMAAAQFDCKGSAAREFAELALSFSCIVLSICAHNHTRIRTTLCT
jgi:hypothetical protein